MTMSDVFVARWAKVKGGEIVRVSATLPPFDDEFPRAHLSVPTITEVNAASCGWFEIEGSEPPDFDPQTHRLGGIAATVTMANGAPTANWGLRALTDAEIAVSRDAVNVQRRALRAAAFLAEHDPLAMKMARGEEVDGEPVTVADLQSKAAEIRARYPYLT